MARAYMGKKASVFLWLLLKGTQLFMLVLVLVLVRVCLHENAREVNCASLCCRHTTSYIW